MSRPTSLDTEMVAGIFKPGGLFSQSLPGYEHRDQQIGMVEAVCNAMNNGLTAVIEAGTGTGKSLAYLVPSLFWAKQAEEKVVISTNTINLQEQLINKDIPFLSAHLGMSFRTALVKGRRNYLCRRRFEAWLRLTDESVPGGLAGRLRRWSRECSEGSRSELPPGIPGYIWDEVSSETESCLRGDCPYGSSCFFMGARKIMDEADLLIVNHHMLFADISVRRESPDPAGEAGILPPYKRLVLDEAHNIEDVATEYLGISVKASDIDYLVASIYKRRSEREIQGLSNGLLKLSGFVGFSSSELVSGIGELVEGRLLPILSDILGGSEKLFSGIQSVAGDGSGDRGSVRIRLTPGVTGTKEWDEQVGSPWMGLCSKFSDLVSVLRRIEGDLKVISESYRVVEESLMIEAKAVRIKAESLLKRLESVYEHKDESYVYWVEADDSEAGPRGALKAAPLDISALIKQEVLDRSESTVFTSATLSVDKGFAYFKESLGINLLDPAKVLESRIDSPFDFGKQALLCIASDVPLPEDPAFTGVVARALSEILVGLGGNTLVLFTSYAMMTVVFHKISQGCRDAGIDLLKQGDESRNTLLSKLRAGGNTALLATDSFWEGVDIPGEALSCVVLVKLPFKVPTDPIQQARHEDLQRRGMNPFMHYSLPQAVIKFKQGFGRLIRSKTDRGVVVVLDRRIVEKRYGKAFIKSLPGCRTKVGPWNELADRAGSWVKGVNGNGSDGSISLEPALDGLGIPGGEK